MTVDVGLMVASGTEPERLAALARRTEEAGFGELWFAEDLFFAGGFSAANTALAATKQIKVGLGVVSAMVRQPAVLAMEIATTARAHPGRFVPGIGLGVASWLRQVDLMPASPLSAVRECTRAVRALLDGAELSQAGRVFGFDRVRLAYPGTERIPLHLGAIGPKMLELSGEIADGSILSVGAGSGYVDWARERIEDGRRRAGRDDPHRVTAFVIYSVDRDRSRARAAARETFAFYKGAGGRNALTDQGGISDQMLAMLERGGATAVAAEMPESWVDEFTVAGTPDDVVGGLRRLLAAGVDSVTLVPVPGQRAAEIVDLTAREVLPHLS